MPKKLTNALPEKLTINLVFSHKECCVCGSYKVKYKFTGSSRLMLERSERSVAHRMKWSGATTSALWVLIYYLVARDVEWVGVKRPAVRYRGIFLYWP